MCYYHQTTQATDLLVLTCLAGLSYLIPYLDGRPVAKSTVSLLGKSPGSSMKRGRLAPPLPCV